MRVQAMTGVRGLGGVARRLGWLIGSRCAGKLDRRLVVAVMGLGHQRLAPRPQEGESEDECEQSA